MRKALTLTVALLVLTLLSSGCAHSLRKLRTPGTVTCSSASTEGFSSTTCWRVKADGGLERILSSTSTESSSQLTLDR